VVEFDHFRREAGLPTFTMSISNWVDKTNAIGVFSKSGKNGGTYAHKDIAFEFGGAISPMFKLYVLKEYQRLKEIESNQYGLEWNVKRVLSKANYQLHTDAIKNYIIPKSGYTQAKEWILYADEADLLNLVLFRCTAKQWREVNPQRAQEWVKQKR
ncbi:MAG TPA: KilA-N domain-containing protein, partial [Mucilaginibacter sp.]